MDMRKDVLGQVQGAFAEGREDIFLAMAIIKEVLEYAKKEGLLALSKDELFRGEGRPYILNIIEAKKNIAIPLKKYLAFGLEQITMGNDFDVLERLMENRYYVNAYTGKDAVIAYIYSMGMTLIVQGIYFEYMLEHFRSIIPDAEEEKFEAFASKCKAVEKPAKAVGRVVQFGQTPKKE